MKKALSIFMAVAIIFSFAACGKSDSGSKSVMENDTKVWYFNDEKIDANELFANVTDTIDPEVIYSSLEIEEDMLYGVYSVNDREKDIKNLSKELTFRDAEFDNGTFNISSLPIAVYSGTGYLPDIEYQYRKVTDREVAALQFIVGEQVGTVPCTYEINGNKIKYTTLTETSASAEDFSYALDKEVFEYEFSLRGPYLTLTDGNDTLKLTAFSFTDNNQGTSTMLDGYSTEKTPLIDELDYFASQQNSFINYAVARDGSYYKTSAYKLTDDGRCTVYLSYRNPDGSERVFVDQYAYIAQSSGTPFLNSFRIILLDGTKAYYYTDSITDREARIMKSEGLDVDNIDESTLKEIAEKKSDLYDDLSKEFEANGITATINRVTGEIALDSTVLFGGDSAELTNDGKDFLNKVIKAYTSIIYNEKYDGFISKTMVEGHTAPTVGSTYESDLQLSEERANNVLNYCLSADTEANTSKLASNMQAIGYSNSKPVYDSDGNVDMTACRRVSFRFIINIED